MALVVGVAIWLLSGGRDATPLIYVLPLALLVGILVGHGSRPLASHRSRYPVAGEGPSQRLAERLRHQTDHDALTGLLSRRRFEHELKRALASLPTSRGAVIVLDLDNFRYINDTQGHRSGDVLLRSIAQIVQERVPSDVVARLSGDEFAILMTETGIDEALDAAENLVATIRQHSVIVGDTGTRVTASVGVALYSGKERPTAEELLVDADLAMYEAKEAGRDRTALYTPSAQDRMSERLNWVERIRAALESDSFVLYCQPILDIAADRVSQYELLIRMVDEDGNVVPPARFLATAERFGLITEIDKWVVRRAIELIAANERAGRDLRLEVNLSGKSVSDPKLLELIEREVAATGIEPSRLIFEVTETAAIANMEKAREFARRLADLGCRFALDDFGTGFGSFYYLKHLPLDYVKIDGEFIERLPYNLTDQLVVKAMVQVAEGLVEQTIAEFVGDNETVKLLQEYGVDYAQGYHIGRPQPVCDLLGDVAAAA